MVTAFQRKCAEEHLAQARAEHYRNMQWQRQQEEEEQRNQKPKQKPKKKPTWGRKVW